VTIGIWNAITFLSANDAIDQLYLQAVRTYGTDIIYGQVKWLCVEYGSVLGYDAVTSQKTLIFIDSAVEISNLTL
jgi:hypothetical protein